jgi:hypothetical protein|tara:strand:- start:466 stop:729 length:264 start_codon:yes stop_codon:yes gene_type:complete
LNRISPKGYDIKIESVINDVASNDFNVGPDARGWRPNDASSRLSAFAASPFYAWVAIVVIVGVVLWSGVKAAHSFATSAAATYGESG